MAPNNDDSSSSVTEKPQDIAVSEEVTPDNGTDEKEDFEKILEEVPPEVRTSIKMMMQRVTGPIYPPHLKQINSGHIDKILTNADEEDKRNHEQKHSTRRYLFSTLIIGLAFVTFLTIYLAKENSELFIRMLTAIIAFLGGFGSGYGAKALRSES